MNAFRTILIVSLSAFIAIICISGFAFADDHWVVFTDGKALYRADSQNPGAKVKLIGTKKEYVTFGHPCVKGKWLWYDKTETGGTKGQRLFCSKWAGGQTSRKMTSDPFGNSSDRTPVVSIFHKGCLYETNRSGTFNLDYTPNGKMGPGFGRSIRYYGACCWGVTEATKNLAYIAGYNGIDIWDRRKPKKEYPIIPYSSDKNFYLWVTRISMNNDKNFLIANSDRVYYLIPNQDLPATPTLTNANEAFMNQDGTKITYAVYENYYTDNQQYQIFSASIDQTGKVSDIQQITTGSLKNMEYSCWPTWCPDKMFFKSEKVSAKLNFTESGKDHIKLSGSVLIPEGTFFDTADVTFGGITESFSLNSDGEKSFKLSKQTPNGKTRMGKWEIIFPKGSFAEKLNLNNSDTATSLSVPLTFTLSSKTSPFTNSYSENVPLKYTAQQGVSGEAVLIEEIDQE